MAANLTPHPLSDLFNGNYDRSHTYTIPSRFRDSRSDRLRGTNLDKKRYKLCSRSLCNSQGNLRYSRNGIPSELLLRPSR